ncbi:MAG TPA: nucleotide sugar dehydrogenase [Candidatus Omnitrophota bacterium]|nr:nucleotide sugar dehydrogenase [Candidatus Omnitrophota bacterium]
MNICVFGLWHLGSVTSACLAKLGHAVVGLDFDKAVVKRLRNGKAPLFEPGLDGLISKKLCAQRLSFTCDAKEALKTAQVVWVTFDTPVNDKDTADILFVERNIKKIMPYLKTETAIIVSSQAPVGFTGKIEKIFRKNFPEKKCYFACSPENLRLGKAIDVFLHPDRIVIGVNTEKTKEVLLPLFSSITDRLEWMKTESAEITKHAINSFLATSICFANEIACLCEKMGADFKEVEHGLKSESRIGPKAYLGAGMAFSGGTLARDVDFLIKLSRKNKLPSHLIKAVSESNAQHKEWVQWKCHELFRNLKKKNIAILGLTYKSGTNTLRRSLAVELAKKLKGEGARVYGYDPIIKTLPADLARSIKLKSNIKDAVDNADLVILATEWPELQEMSPEMIQLMMNKVVIDPGGFLLKVIGSGNENYFYVGKGNEKRSKG